MDNEFAELEAELKQLRPRAPRADLEARLEEMLAPNASVSSRRSSRRPRGRSDYTTATTWTSWPWVNWGVAAALVTLMAVWSAITPPRGNRTPSVPATAEVASLGEPTDARGEPLKPVRAGRTLLASRIDGVVELADGSAAQRVRDYYVDTIVWRDAAGRSQLKWEVPREAVRFVGLAAY